MVQLVHQTSYNNSETNNRLYIARVVMFVHRSVCVMFVK